MSPFFLAALMSQANKILLMGWTMSVMLGFSPLPKTGVKWQEDQTVFERRHMAESAADKTTRFRSIARDLVDVIAEDGALPGMTKRQSMALMLSIMSYESSFFRDVDLGVGKGVGDNGRSYCLMQLQVNEASAPVGPDGKKNLRLGLMQIRHDVMGAWTGDDVVSDRKKCFRAGRTILARGMGECRDQKAGDKLSAYATGHCHDNEPKSRLRWSRFEQIMRKRVPTIEESLALLGRASVEDPAPQVEEARLTQK